MHGHSAWIRITCASRAFFRKECVRMNVVYVLSPERAPLMPCSCVIARLLLKHGKAKVVRRTPFTIQLLSQPENIYTQPLTLGVDTGSSVMGSAVADENGHVLYLSEVEIRNDIAQTMKERAASRRNRRQRKTRYRPVRWLNRKHSTGRGRFSPTIKTHAKFLITSHLIFVCKYREKLVIPYGKVVKRIGEEIGARSECSFAPNGGGSRAESWPC